MSRNILFFGVLYILSNNLISQINFENGYFVRNSGERINCQIKNMDWQNNPVDIQYRISENDEIQSLNINYIKEFGIENVAKFVRENVEIDDSSDNLEDLNNEMNPKFKEEQLFLKILVDGKATLYQYQKDNLVRFFYKVGDSDIKQLIYKRYIIDGKLMQNNLFKQQLFQDLKCSSIKTEDANDLEYKRPSLENFFKKYYKCSNESYVEFEKNNKRDLFNLTIRPSLNFNKLEISNSESSSRDTKFNSEVSFKIGLEAEFILPFNKNKWGIIVEPTYQSYKSKKTFQSSNLLKDTLTTSVDYHSIELPIGLRHYFFLNNNSKLYINLLWVLDFSNNSSIKFQRKDGTIYSELDINSRSNIAFGMGYKYKNRYSLELRYHSNRELFDYVYWDSKYSQLNLTFGYTLF